MKDVAFILGFEQRVGKKQGQAGRHSRWKELNMRILGWAGSRADMKLPQISALELYLYSGPIKVLQGTKQGQDPMETVL